ncbi:MAG: TatD family hydrolase [Gammaproteobacteria bacterium]|uniref:TatD family hydrolase n=1 Tax=Candidatus Thiopontia autotrophica TaxID=2841688 RepID=A0A8J6PAT0_9GAMM|nr:TatD family hydrolase [Candidatus Thiopontia autotrophica]MBL6969705.1 TatD family hydrolase [Gammaproteobacteria bacterium]
MIDSHCHLDFPDFDRDRDKVISNCIALGVDQIIIPGVSSLQWDKALQLRKKQSCLRVAIGLHPLFLAQHTTEDLTALDTVLSSNSDIVAVGEIGLDYYLPDSDRQGQRELFIRQLDIAREHKRPLLLHVRKAHQEAVQILHEHNHYGGVVHAFSGSLEQAQQYIEMGFLIGVGGVVTRPNAAKLHRTVREVSLHSIALETDAPDLPPVWARGERNSPEQLPAIAQAIADIRGESLDRVAEESTKNIVNVLELS